MRRWRRPGKLSSQDGGPDGEEVHTESTTDIYRISHLNTDQGVCVRKLPEARERSIPENERYQSPVNTQG